MMSARSRSVLIKWVMGTIIIIWLINVAAAIEFSHMQWDTVAGTSGIIKRDGVISFMGYTVKATAFNAPVESDKYKNIPIAPVEAFVGLNILKNGTMINETMLGRGESYITPDGELMVTVKDLPASFGTEWLYESYGPWVKLELNPRGIPRFDLLVDMDDEYISTPNTEIVVKVIVKNSGTADMQNVDLEVGSKLSLLRGNLKFNYAKIPKGGQVSETMTFSAPIITELTKYDIYTNVSGSDVKENSYNRVLLKTIVIVPPTQKIPILMKSTNAKMYLKDYNLVSLSFKNTLNHELKNVSITDSLPKGFKQISNNSLNWLVDVPANEEWNSRYITKPIKADNDGIIFPAAKAEFKIKNEYYMVQSNKPEIIVYGPDIVLDKKTDVSEINPGDLVTVTVVAVNNGSTPSKVSITDTVPDDVTFLSGSTSKEEYLEANKDVKFSYVIRSDSKSPFKLPAAEAEYFELGDRGVKIGTKSQEPLIRIKPAPTPVPTPGPAPVPSIEPEVEALLTSDSDASEMVVPFDDVEEQSAIEEQEPVNPSIDVNIILDIILGCDRITSIDLQNVMISDICNLINNPNN